VPETCDGTGQIHLGSNCYKRGQTLLQRTSWSSCCGWWCQAWHSILAKDEVFLIIAWSLAGWMWESEALRRDVGTWLLTCTCICTCVCLGASVPGQGAGPRAGTFTCLTNNILRIDCHWSAAELGQGSSPWLLFTRRLAAPTSAPSRAMRARWCCHPRMCSCPPTTSPSLSTTGSPGRSWSAWWTLSTCPGDMSNVSSGYCVLTWSISPALEPMTTLLSYELAFKRQEEAWEWARHKDRIVGVTWLILEATELDPGFTYEARLRVQMANLEDDVAEGEHYAGQWSEWSQPVLFPSPQRRGPLIPPWGRPDSTLVAVSIFLLLTGLTYLLFKLSPRPGRGPTEPVCS
uniref:Fibronectin type-III domain-containing protein n=1 Tax=Propithecus coquereli TaxID=379532 RepID=A0A2K6EQS6_PROCO